MCGEQGDAVESMEGSVGKHAEWLMLRSDNKAANSGKIDPVVLWGPVSSLALVRRRRPALGSM